MEIIISGRKLGTSNNHLSYNGKNFRWTSEIRDGAWLFGFDDSAKDLEIVANAIGREISTFDSSPHGRANNIIFGDTGIEIPWMHVMPKGVFHKQLQKLLKQLWGILTEESDQYYMNQFLFNRELLMTLKPPLIDIPVLREIIKNSSLKRSEMLKFMPHSGDLAPRTIYNQMGSVTGRLTVSDGPNILTLKRDHRKILKSRFKEGKIIQIDISSLEPRIALSVAGKESPDDIYEAVGEKVLGGELTRDEVKVAVLSCMYGATSWSLSKQLPDDIDADRVLIDIKRYFEISQLNSKLEAEIMNRGHIENLYGKPIKGSESLINHFLQSSGVDVSFNVFSQILSDLRDSDINFTPIYVIHDALVVDIEGRHHSKVKKLTSNGYKVKNLDCIFPVKVEIIREN